MQVMQVMLRDDTLYVSLGEGRPARTHVELGIVVDYDAAGRVIDVAVESPAAWDEWVGLIAEHGVPKRVVEQIRATAGVA